MTQQTVLHDLQFYLFVHWIEVIEYSKQNHFLY